MSGVPASETSAIEVPGTQPLDERRRLLPLVVFVEARRARRDGVVLKKPRRPAGVLSRDEGDFAKNSEGAQRDIFEVADGSGDHIQDAGHARGADSTRMYSAEPLPHFVDEYLAWLHETHPTNATFDGVHLHDDLLEDLSRAAIDAQIRDLGGFARRLAAIDPDAADRQRSGSSGRRSTPTSGAAAFRARNGPHLGAQPAVLRRSPFDEPRRAGALRLRAARRARAARPVEAAPGPAPDAGGARQHQGSARHLHQGRAREPSRHAAIHRDDLPRAFGGLHDMRVLGDLADASTEAAAGHRRVRLLPRERGRAARARLRSASAATCSSRSCASDEGITLDADRLLAIAIRELRATQEEFRRVARASIEAKDPMAAWARAKSDHPAAGHVVATAQEQLEELKTFIQRQDLVSLPGVGAGAGRADPALLPLDVRQHVDAGPVRNASDPRLLLHHRCGSRLAGRAAGRAPARLQLRRAVGDLHPRGLPRPLPPLPAPAPGERARCRKSILFSSTAMVEGWAHYAEQMMVDAGFRKQDPNIKPRPARRSADPALPAHRRHPAALRGSLGRAGRAVLPRRGVSSKRRPRAARPSAAPSIPPTSCIRSAS